MNETKIKTFTDLDFHAHRTTDNAIQARLDLDHGIEISVVSHTDSGNSLYGNVSKGTYEVAVFRKNQMLPLSTSDDVLGWQANSDIDALMGNLQGDLDSVCEFIDALRLAKSEMRSYLGLDS
jgi:hypothetical protein